MELTMIFNFFYFLVTIIIIERSATVTEGLVNVLIATVTFIVVAKTLTAILRRV
jgi:hypothetical protein